MPAARRAEKPQLTGPPPQTLSQPVGEIAGPWNRQARQPGTAQAASGSSNTTKAGEVINVQRDRSVSR